MADSENSRTLSTVTRRNLMSSAVMSVPALVSGLGLSAALAHQDGGQPPVDQVLPVWNEWLQATDRLLEFSKERRLLETKLFAVTGPPPILAVAWEEADKLFGFRRVVQSEERAADSEDELANALLMTPACSITGVKAKLYTILNKGEPSRESDEFPWPQIRLILLDLGRIDRASNTQPCRFCSATS